jgi:sorting nexin-1/2
LIVCFFFVLFCFFFFFFFSQSEQEEGVDGGVASALDKMGSAADSLSVLAAEQAEGEEVYFELVLREYLRMIHAVKKALDKRAERRLTYTTCVQEVQTKRSVVDKYRGYPGKEDKAFQAQASLQRAQDAAEVAREDFATVSQRILREMDRFKREKAEEMRCTVLNYMELQIQYNQKMEDIWARLIPDLERISVTTTTSSNNPDEVDLDIPSGGGGGGGSDCTSDQ